MRWSDFSARQPLLAAVGREKLLGPGVVLVVTIRRDGTPRLSPVEPFVMDGELWLSMLMNSTKAVDLARDPRILVHSIVTGPDGAAGEFKVRGRARAETNPSVQHRYAAAVGKALGWHPVPGKFHLFAVQVDDVTFIRYEGAAGDQFVTRWPRGGEFVRRGTSATSLGGPEPRHELLNH
jgi:hypothetical protein